MKNKVEILHKYTSDMVGIEKHFLEILGYQASDNRLKNYKEASDMVVRVQETLKMHIRMLDHYMESLDVGKAESSLKKAATKISGMATGFYNLMRQEDTVMRNLRDDYVAMHMVVISYTMLYSTALAHHDDTLADIALKNMRDLTPLIFEMSRIIPAIVIKELSWEGKAPDVSVIEKAISDTQAAWRLT
ncbi:MAG: hypothetical protein VR64_02070 [Desulfatitalea sp. BRH_c12]|nr:MAG: hypothetical protein VR64_02070 [Desulfatitalea sp. BRH_c12]